uniref:Bleomycin hydrolase n=1 Tax=Eptatretus burgeri TaxID=7764 RepID=A0A8C4Q344_EPTBU
MYVCWAPIGGRYFAGNQGYPDDIEQTSVHTCTSRYRGLWVGGVSEEKLLAMQARLQARPELRLAQAVAITQDPLEAVAAGRAARCGTHVFTHCVSTEGKPVCNQKKSGRCWIFACLNTMRLPLMKKFNVEELELSQTYIFFWDKVERANFLLRTFAELAEKGEEVGGRLIQFLLTNPAEDGGQWQMLVNIVEKYGVVPKKAFPETHASEASRRMNETLSHKMRECCARLHRLVSKGCSKEELEKTIDSMLEEVYQVLSICLGCPPDTFVWEYRDKDKVSHRIGPISPRDFYTEHVQPVYNITDKVCLVNDPRPYNSYGELYTVAYLSNMVGGRLTLYNNQDIKILRQAAADSIQAGEAVWFGCDSGKQCNGKAGVSDLQLFDYEMVFGVKGTALNKADRMIYGDSMMDHAMVITAYSEKDEGTSFEKWRVENSWGDERGHKGESTTVSVCIIFLISFLKYVHNVVCFSTGYLQMSDDWFGEYVFEVVVDKRFLSENILSVFDKKPHVLPAWDPMGALA